ANLFSSPYTEEAPPPQAPATGSGTLILQNNIFGWNTAGIMIDFPPQSEEVSVNGIGGSFVAPSGLEIRRNTIANTCAYRCYFGSSPEGELPYFFGGAGIVIGAGAGVTITNNWFRDN